MHSIGSEYGPIAYMAMKIQAGSFLISLESNNFSRNPLCLGGRWLVCKSVHISLKRDVTSTILLALG
jgi:hypothetical protein